MPTRDEMADEIAEAAAKQFGADKSPMAFTVGLYKALIAAVGVSGRHSAAATDALSKRVDSTDQLLEHIEARLALLESRQQGGTDAERPD